MYESVPSVPTAKTAMVSCSRFPAYTNLPTAETRISEQKLLPANFGGRVEIVCRALSRPYSAS